MKKQCNTPACSLRGMKVDPMGLTDCLSCDKPLDDAELDLRALFGDPFADMVENLRRQP